MTSQLKIEVGDTVRIAHTSGYYNSCFKNNPMCEGVVVEDCGPLDVDWDNGFSNTYQSYDLILIKKGKAMQFTKSDLKTGMFVKQRNGNFKVVLGNAICDDNNYGRLDEYKENLINICENTAHDIIAVYKTSRGSSLISYLAGDYLTTIWERTEQTEAQKEMVVLQAQIDKGAAYMAELHEQAKRLQTKM